MCIGYMQIEEVDSTPDIQIEEVDRIGHVTPGYLGTAIPVQGYLAHKKHPPP